MAETWEVMRVTNESNIDRLVEINTEVFTHPWTREMFLDELSHPRRSYLLAVYGPSRIIVGYCSVWRVDDTLQVNSIAVVGAYQGRGVGGALLDEVVTLGRRLRVVSVSLEVRSSNDAARGLYRRYHFKETGRRSAYYSQPTEDAVILTKHLESHRGV